MSRRWYWTSICDEATKILKSIVANQSKKVIEFKLISSLTIENRLKHKQAIPIDTLNDLKSCDVILKGPTTTPQKGDNCHNIESANVAMRRA